MNKKDIKLKSKNVVWIDKHGLHKHNITIKEKRPKSKK